jgi:hypothetical protein
MQSEKLERTGSFSFLCCVIDVKHLWVPCKHTNPLDQQKQGPKSDAPPHVDTQNASSRFCPVSILWVYTGACLICLNGGGVFGISQRGIFLYHETLKHSYRPFFHHWNRRTGSFPFINEKHPVLWTQHKPLTKKTKGLGLAFCLFEPEGLCMFTWWEGLSLSLCCQQ